jgi:hypothetical protein
MFLSEIQRVQLLPTLDERTTRNVPNRSKMEGMEHEL